MTPVTLFRDILKDVVRNRVYPLESPANPSFPFIIYRKESETEYQTLHAPTGFFRLSLSVDVVSLDYAELDRLMVVIRDRIHALQGHNFPPYSIKQILIGDVTDQKQGALARSEQELFVSQFDVTLYYERAR